MLLKHAFASLEDIDQFTLWREAIEGDAGQCTIVAHPVDIDEVVAITCPDPISRNSQAPL